MRFCRRGCRSVPAVVVVVALGVLGAALGTVGAWDIENTPPDKILEGDNTEVNPHLGLAFDSSGNMYVGSYWNNSVTVYASGWASGSPVPSKTLTGDGATGLGGPVGLAFDASGNMYVANIGANSVTVYASGWASGAAPTKTLTGDATGLRSPWGLAIDASGNMYVVNHHANTVTMYASGWASGNTLPSKTLTGLSSPLGVAIDASGNMYVANAGARTVTMYESGWASGNTAPSKTLAVSGAVGLAFDSSGNMYVTDSIAHSVTMYESGWVNGTAPTKTLIGDATALSSPLGVAFDASGNMHVTNGGSADRTGGRRSVTVYATSGDANTAQPLRYWKTATLDSPPLPLTLGAYDVDTQAEARAVFKATNCGVKTGDAVGCLAGQLLVAKLNIADGVASGCITTTVTNAHTFLTAPPTGTVNYTGPGSYTLTKSQRRTALDMVDSLVTFNTSGCP
jgi:sugar lactone lactonase YvrE